MWSYKRSAVAVAMAVVVACAGAGSASATQISPVNTAFVLTSTNSELAVSGGGTVGCTDASISGTTPAAGAATWKTTKVTLAYNNCTAFWFPEAITVPTNCSATGANAITLQVMYNGSSDIAAQVTIPTGCTITVAIPAIACTLTIAGPQTLGNGTSGTGGIAWTNGTSTVKSTATLNSAGLPSIASSGGGFGCPTAGAHTSTLSGTYSVTTPTAFPGLTVTA
jgi:hypothetical protein